MNIILSGFMGSGKTTVAKTLAKISGRTVIDIDDYIENKSGMTVAEIFEKYGENHFRTLEQQAVEDVSKMDNLVVATGGGTVLNHDNAKALKTNGVIVFLDVSVDTILRRLKNDTTRPLLQKPNKECAITELLMGRMPIYSATADLVIDHNDDDQFKTAQVILERIKNL